MIMNSKTFIIAEMSANHGHSLDMALETVSVAKKAGADAIKIQTYTADTITLNCDKPEFMAEPGGLWDGYRLYDLYQKAYTPWEWHKAIFEEAKKIASFEITDIPLIEYIASKQKPIIMSTGVATIEDINLALEACRRVGNNDITLLKCTSAYPAPIEDANLATMRDMKERFGVKVGLSDHTLGSDVAVAAVALGAEGIEKHFIIDRAIGGPDCEFSMNKEEFAAMVKSIRNVEKAIGRVTYPTDISQIKGRQFSRSLYVAENMKKGDVITEKNVRSVRPGYGLHPKYLPQILGKTVNRDLEMGTRMSFDFID